MYSDTRDATINSILEILKDGKFISPEGVLLEKGSIACELNNCHPLLLADFAGRKGSLTSVQCQK